MERAQQPKPRTFAALIGLLLLGACAGQGAADPVTRPGAARSAGVAGLVAPFDDAELTERVELVVRGSVESREVVALADDPDLPSDWESDPEASTLVTDGAGHVKWRISIDAWEKGESAPSIWAVRGVAGGSVGFGSQGAPTVGAYPQPGERYKLWLSRDHWFGAPYHILLRAREL